ncbi:unnamed protein product [Cuscuta campestris]|uniref:Ubiquitin-like protease family profile domain-containing protein n=1 Tax=Cuscuta campestris TaxID=132261 RepID=A0A484LB15_9ASTE|nr:unnamed protein product [Cuscuta campestris]
MKTTDVAKHERNTLIRRRSVRIAMAKEEVLRNIEQTLSEDEALDEILLIKRMEKAQERQVNIRDAFVRQSVCEKVKERQVNIRDAFVREKTAGEASGNVLKVNGEKVCVANTDSEHLDMVKEIKEIKEKQDAQDKKLDEILGILRQKTASVETSSGKGSLMGGNEEPIVRNEVDEVGVEIQNDKSGNVSVTEASDPVKEGKYPDIPFTETQYDPCFLELIDRVLRFLARGLLGRMRSRVGAREVLVVMILPRYLGSSGSNKGKLGQHIEGGKRRRSLDDDDFERIFTSSRVGSGDLGVNVAHDALVVFSTGLDSITACVEIDRPKRVHNNPERYTPTEVEHDKEKRKLERMDRAKLQMKRVRSEVCHGPFSKDPKVMPAYGEIQKVREFLNEGLLKRQGRKNSTCRYTCKEENMTKCPIVLDGFKVENKTWLYELFTNTEWLRSTHVEIAMHFLEVKGRQYNLLQMYTTTSPYFLQGDHWMLLVLEVEGRTIRVYDSKGRKGKSCRALNEYMQCITELLPVLLDLLSVCDEHSDGPMGKKKFNIKVVDECPQQDDGCNCGMFMLKFAEYLMMDRHISEVHARDMEGYRVKMTTELMVYSKERKEKAGDK